MSFLLDTDICSAYLKGDHRIGLTLVTHNVEDYANVPGLEVVDWLAT